MDNKNIKYYFYCRHKLGVDASAIGTEINQLFQVKIPIREGLKNWAECIETNKKNSFLFNYDEKNKACFENLQFQLINREPVETQMIQFYALCRYQLNIEFLEILEELNDLYGPKAPLIESFHMWILNNWKKPNEKITVPITEIDLTRDETEENDLAVQFEPESELETVNEPDSEPNPVLKFKQDSNIKYYFCCRSKLNEKIVQIQAELKKLFQNDLLPQTIGALYHWDKKYHDEKKIDQLFNYDSDNKSEFERLKFALNCSYSNRIKKMQFYSLCRYQLSEQPSEILIELKQLYKNDAPPLSILNTWITELWNDKTRSETIEQDQMEVPNDFSIEIQSKFAQINTSPVVSQYLARLQKLEQNLITERDSFVFDLKLKDDQIEQLHSQINMLKSQNQTIQFDLDDRIKCSKQFEEKLQKEKELNFEIKSNESLMQLNLKKASEKIKIKEIEYEMLKDSKDSQLEVVTQQFTESQKDFITNIEQVLMQLKTNNQIGIQTIQEDKLNRQIQQLELFKSKIKEINIVNDEQNSIQIKNLTNEINLNALQIETLQNETNYLKSSESKLKMQLNELKIQTETNINSLTDDLNVAKTTLNFFKLNLKDCECKNIELEARITKTVSEYRKLKENSLREIMEYVNDINKIEKTIDVYKLQLEEKESTAVTNNYSNYKREKEQEIKNLKESFNIAEKNLINSYKIKIHKLDSMFLAETEKLKLENSNLKQLNSQNEEALKMQQKELEQLRRQRNEPFNSDNQSRLLEVKLAESNIQIQIWEKNYINLQRDLENLSDENLTLKADSENVSELNGVLKSELNELKKYNRPSDDYFLKVNQLKSQINDFKQNISTLKNQLDESYEFLLEKDSNLNKLNQDIYSFNQSLNLIFEYFSLNNQEINGIDLMNDNILLSKCLQKVQETFETFDLKSKIHEKKKFKIISIENDSSFREKKLLQVKIVKPPAQYVIRNIEENKT